MNFYAYLHSVILIATSSMLLHCSSAKHPSAPAHPNPQPITTTQSEAPALANPPQNPNSGSQNVSMGALQDCQYTFAKNFTSQYCSDCHTTTGTFKHKDKALQNITMDTYHDWMQASRTVPRVLDKHNLESKIMPPAKYPYQPTDSEREVMIEWLNRGSPNTDSGK